MSIAQSSVGQRHSHHRAFTGKSMGSPHGCHNQYRHSSREKTEGMPSKTAKGGASNIRHVSRRWVQNNLKRFAFMVLLLTPSAFPWLDLVSIALLYKSEKDVVRVRVFV